MENFLEKKGKIHGGVKSQNSGKAIFASLSKSLVDVVVIVYIDVHPILGFGYVSGSLAVQSMILRRKVQLKVKVIHIFSRISCLLPLNQTSLSLVSFGRLQVVN